MVQIPIQEVDYPETSVPMPQLRQMNIRVDPYAWGAVGAAVEHLGATEQQVAGEVRDRAFAIQDIKNEAAVNSKSAETELTVGENLEKLKSLQGDNAVQAYKTFGAEQEAYRQRQRDSLENDAQRRAFDGITRNIVTRANIYGANHAAQQQRNVLNAGDKAQEENALNDLVLNADDPRALRDNMQRLDDLALKRAATEGWQNNPDIVDALRGDNKSKGLGSIIRGLAKHDPDKAQDFLNQNRPYFRQKELQQAQAEIQATARNAGTRVPSMNLREGYMPYMTGHEKEMLKSVQGPLKDVTNRAAEILLDQKKQLEVSSGRRTPEEQERLYRRYLAGGPLAASPELSHHVWGGALDITPRTNPTPGYTAASYADIRAAMTQAAQELGVQWSRETNRMRATGIDKPHWSLEKDQNFADYKPPDKIPVDKRMQMGVDFVESKYSDDPVIGDYFRQRFQNEVGYENQLRIATERDQRNILDGVMMDRGDGQEPENLDQWLSNPKVEAIRHTLLSQPGGNTLWQNEIERFNTWLRMRNAATDPVEAARLEGLATSKDYDENLQFLDEMKDITKNSKIGRAEQKHLLLMKNKLLQAAQGDQKVGHAMGIATANLPYSVTSDRDQMNIVRGIISKQMQAFSDAYQKLPNDNDILGMVERLKSTRANTPADVSRPWNWLHEHLGVSLGEGPQLMKETPPTADYNAIKQEYQRQYQSTPDDQTITIIWLNRRYRERYGGERGAPPPRPPGVRGGTLPLEAPPLPAAPGLGR